MRRVLIVVGLIFAATLTWTGSSTAMADPDRRQPTPPRVGIDHVQLRAYITYKPTGDKGQEIKRTFLRFKEARDPDAGVLPAKPSSAVPDPSARFFSDIVGDSLVECYYASLEPIGDLMAMTSAYCIQTRGVDGSGFGAYIETAATCGLRARESGSRPLTDPSLAA